MAAWRIKTCPESVNLIGHFAVLDLGELRAIHIDASRAEAWVGSGATLGELYYAAAAANQKFGFPAGNCPTVGVGGHLSGGGFSALSRKYGLSADNVLDAVVVDAEGRLLNRSTMGKDLFWAIRGGGWRRYMGKIQSRQPGTDL
ncbi:berberine bridge enzyme-like Cyn d 4 [Setaria viridis]|uniref:berberine bridge enzyme-like Cyn d 4 n=1 Tax=Setaria viridis TaxID=4556 RepID=UPI003B3A2454